MTKRKKGTLDQHLMRPAAATTRCRVNSRGANETATAARKRECGGQSALQAKQNVAQWKRMPGCSAESCSQSWLEVSLGVHCLRWGSNRQRQLCKGAEVTVAIYTRAFNPFAVGCRQTLEIFLLCVCPADLTELGRCLLPSWQILSKSAASRCLN